MTSLVGYSLIWDSIDDRKNPTSGIYANFHQDIAGLGGQSQFVRETFDGKYYYPITDDLTGLVRLQAGQINQIGGGNLPLTRQLQPRSDAGARLRARAASARATSPTRTTSRATGSAAPPTSAASAEVQFPIFGLPREIGLKGAVFADAGTLFGFHGRPISRALLGYYYIARPARDEYRRYTQPSCLNVDDEHVIRSSVGASLIWASPLGPIRIDYAYASSRANTTRCRRSTSPAARGSDRRGARQPNSKRARLLARFFMDSARGSRRADRKGSRRDEAIRTARRRSAKLIASLRLPPRPR